MDEPIEYDVSAPHIIEVPGFFNGRPFIVGSQVCVQDVYVWHELIGVGADEIASANGLTMAQVYAALTFAYDHLDRIETALQADQRFGPQQPSSPARSAGV